MQKRPAERVHIANHYGWEKYLVEGLRRRIEAERHSCLHPPENQCLQVFFKNKCLYVIEVESVDCDHVSRGGHGRHHHQDPEVEEEAALPGAVLPAVEAAKLRNSLDSTPGGEN